MDKINPNHYKQIQYCECIDITEQNTFCIGNTIKYIWRLGYKDIPQDDANKAIWYLNRAISNEEEVFGRFDLMNVAYELTASDMVKAHLLQLLANQKLEEAREYLIQNYT